MPPKRAGPESQCGPCCDYRILWYTVETSEAPHQHGKRRTIGQVRDTLKGSPVPSSRPSLSPDARAAIARANVLNRHRPAGHPQLVEARRDAAAATLADYVSAVVAEAPPLTDAQRDRIAALLRPTKARDAA